MSRTEIKTPEWKIKEMTSQKNDVFIFIVI